MKILFGFIVITFGFKLSLEHLNQSVAQFWDVIAFSIVALGTFATSFMTLPSLKLKHIFSIVYRGINNNQGLREDCISNAMNLIKGYKFDPSQAKRLDQRVLIDGYELMKLGFTSEKIKSILSMRIDKYLEDGIIVSTWVKGLSKYPPAFGLAGTVLGLVHLMKGLSEGADPQETGMRMAIALIATFYGIVIANIFVSPIGDRIHNNLLEDERLANISLEAVLLINNKVNLVEAIEEMNAHLPGHNNKLSFENYLKDVA
tara:strand:- start:77207 stop:77983 length:777 start_codon:yes stop_codon:yes gene_type:complete